MAPLTSRAWDNRPVTDLVPSSGIADAPARTHAVRVPRRAVSYGAPVRAARAALPALALYAAVRALGVLALALWGLADGKDAHKLLSARWDSLWYARVAEDGYGYTLHLAGGKVHSDLAFFPLLPWLERGVSALTGLRAGDAGLVVSALASLAAAWGVFAVGERLYGRRAGVVLVVLWAALPVGVVQSMAYSESLFTALAAWSLYAVLTGRWVAAGTLAALAGLTRPVGAAVVAAVWLGALVALRRGERSWRLPVGVLLAPLGWLGYVAWVGVRRGSVTGYLDVQGGWGNGFDGGLAFGSFIAGRLAGPAFPAGLGLLLGVAGVIWLYVAGVRRGQPLPVLAYTGTVLLLALTAKGYFGSKPRLMMPAFPLLLPLAVALARLRTARVALVLAPVALASAVYGAFWLHGSGPP
ncbi:membrane protein [Streptomyces mashuensis]|uniref:Membrane protein n=1 Tax=Streptomyces mashuensis TaxID=33904 RepID=A0A919ECJ2_9ACTN|nr:membrane protein [Streptomyces mashuensis]